MACTRGRSGGTRCRARATPVWSLCMRARPARRWVGSVGEMWEGVGGKGYTGVKCTGVRLERRWVRKCGHVPTLYHHPPQCYPLTTSTVHHHASSTFTLSRARPTHTISHLQPTSCSWVAVYHCAPPPRQCVYSWRAHSRSSCKSKSTLYIHTSRTGLPWAAVRHCALPAGQECKRADHHHHRDH